MKKGFITVLLCVLLSAITAYGVVVKTNVQGGSSRGAAFNDGDAVQYRTVNLSQSEYPDFTYAAESAVDAVVYVEVTVVTQNQYQMDPFFRFFFGDQYSQPQSREQKGSGSGVIIRPDGYIVTNNHVVNGASKVKIVLNNNKSYDATVVGSDPDTDVAVVKIDAEGLPTIPFGDSDNLRLGEWVLAIGSPLNLRSTITAGIVSAKGRSMAAYGSREDAQNSYKIESFIQTDAAVNPGNSGGALVNKEGELVGINTAIISQTGSYSGYSFAVPVNIVKKVVGDLIEGGVVRRALLGIVMQPISDEIAKELKLSSMNGVYINEVSKGGAADKAGLKKGDVIVAIGGTKVTDGASVQEKVASYHPGDKTTVTFVRDGKEQTVNVVFQGTVSDTGTKDADGAVSFYGSKLRTASAETLSKLGIKSGVEIVSVGPGKVLDAGASEGFVIQFVNDEPVSKPEDVIAIAKKARRSIFIQGVKASGRKAYFGFGKDE
ncbi:MAG: Do family serine endopeptidase [Bacteroidales bacterium]|nr:Do family serine endopeptidase [Bacteroidales bacterium]